MQWAAVSVCTYIVDLLNPTVEFNINHAKSERARSEVGTEFSGQKTASVLAFDCVPGLNLTFFHNERSER